MPDGLDMTWSRVSRIWWAFAWRALVASVVVGAVLGAVGGLVVTVATGSAEASGVAGGLLGGIGSIPASRWALRLCLRKRYRDFRVELVQI
jgi:hypothetical protein